MAGAVNRVYFQARTTLGKPADLKGRVVDETGRVVAHAETLTDDTEPGINQGMGRFEFTPEAGQSYQLMIDQPVGTEGEYKLPPVQTEGVVLTALSEVSGDPDPIRVRVTCPSVGRTLLVGAYARGRLLDHRRITVAANQSADVELKPEAGDRWRHPGHGVRGTSRRRARRSNCGRGRSGWSTASRHDTLNLSCEPDKSRYVPGDHVALSLKATNEKHEPVPAIAMVGVVNKSVVTMADEKTFRTMPTHFLLTSEVQRPEDLEHADVLLGSHPKAAAALDLLLGTQGWRRFVEQNVPPPNKGKADGEPVLVATANSPRIEASSYMLALQSVQDKYGPALAKAETGLSAANRAVGAFAGRSEPRRRRQAIDGRDRSGADGGPVGRN